MRKLLLPAFLVLCFLSCADEKLPKGILPVNTMKPIVWEMEVADQTASSKFMLQKDSQRMEATSLYQQVFAKYKVNKKTFYNSFSYYESHPDLMKVLFDSVTNYGNRQKSKSYNQKFGGKK